MKGQLQGSSIGSSAVVVPEEVDVVPGGGGGGGMGDVVTVVSVGAAVVDPSGTALVDVSAPALSPEASTSALISTTGPHPMGQSSTGPATRRTMTEGSRFDMLGSWVLVAWMYLRYRRAAVFVLCVGCSPSLVPAGGGETGGSATTTGVLDESGSSAGSTGENEIPEDTDTDADGPADPHALVARLVYVSDAGVVAHDIRASGEIGPEAVLLPGVWSTLRAHGDLYSVQSRSFFDWDPDDVVSHAIFDPFGTRTPLGLSTCPSSDDCTLFKVGETWALSSNGLEPSWGTVHTFTIEDGAATELEAFHPFDPEVYGGPVAVVEDYFVWRTQDRLDRVSVPDGAAELLVAYTEEADQWSRMVGPVLELLTEGTPGMANVRSRVEFVDVLASDLRVQDVPLQDGFDELVNWLHASGGILTVQGVREEPIRDVSWFPVGPGGFGPPVQLTQGALERRATGVLAHRLDASGDGTWFAFGAQLAGGSRDIYLTSTHTLGAASLVAEDAHFPYFSKDGRYLYFMVRDSGNTYTARRLELQSDGALGAAEVVSTRSGSIWSFSDDENWLIVGDGIADLRTSPPTISEVEDCSQSLRFVSPDGIIVSCDSEESADLTRPIFVHRITGQVVELEGEVFATYIAAPN